MNKKAIIFTIDAIIALSIFIAVAIAMYSILSPEPTIGIQSSSIYANSENFMRSADANESFSRAFYELQVGNSSGAEQILGSLLEDLPYPATIRIYEHDGTNMIHLLTVNEQDFTTSIVLRKFLVLSLTANTGTYFDPFMNIAPIESSEPPIVLPLTTTVLPDMSEGMPQLNIQVVPEAFDSLGQSTGWTIIPINPPVPEVNFVDYSDPPAVLEFAIDVPPNAPIGEYQLQVTASNGGNYNQFGYTQFNVIKYGFVELEVKTS